MWHHAELSLGGQLLYVSGLVLLRPPRSAMTDGQGEEEDVLLPCLKGLIDEVGASGQEGGGGGASSSPREYAQLGKVQGELLTLLMVGMEERNL